MNFERNDYYRDLEDLHDQCKKCAYYHVIVTMKDGNTFDGIIEDADMDGVNMLVGEDVMERDDEERQYHGYGRPRRRFRRFRRRRFPLASLAAVSLLPFPVATPFFPFI